MVFLILAALAVGLFFVCMVFCDCDLVLAFCEKFGKKPECLGGKVIWVTGASTGIGKALALKLASLRCRIAISARREELLNSVKAECLALGAAENDVLVVAFDVVDHTQHGKALKQILDHFSQLDILVNNAGVSQRARFEKVDMAVDRRIFDVNVFSVVGLSTLVLNHFIDSKKTGHIAAVSSIAGKAGVPCSRSYTASKHALHGYFECLRVEKSNDVSVTMICPGPVFSDVLRNAATEKPDECCGKDFAPGDKRMSAERCADLIAISLANKLGEVWISLQPILLSFYAWQYLPGLTRWIFTLVGSERLMKYRDGRIVLQK